MLACTLQTRSSRIRRSQPDPALLHGVLLELCQHHDRMSAIRPAPLLNNMLRNAWLLTVPCSRGTAGAAGSLSATRKNWYFVAASSYNLPRPNFARETIDEKRRCRWQSSQAAPTVSKLLSGAGRILQDAARPGASPLSVYSQLVASGALAHDDHQVTAVNALQQLHERLLAQGPPSSASTSSSSTSETNSSGSGSGGGWLSSIFSRPVYTSSSSTSSSRASTVLAAGGQSANPGLYLWGGTGSGKTMLMEIFFACQPHDRKRRVHFHEFMLDVHSRLHKMRGAGHRGDPLQAVAKDIVAQSWLLCFDEFQVTDIGDAMILKRLFSAMFDAGVVMVATSNRAPETLYYQGLQRELFLPFIDLLRQRCIVHHITSGTDYRLLATSLQAGATWIVLPHAPLHGAGAVQLPPSSAFEAAWSRAIGGGAQVGSMTLDAQGRSVPVNQCVLDANIKAARFSFQDLCSQPLYAADYQAIATTFQTVFIEGIPRLTLGERNELRRLITLIDILYDHGVKVVVSAADEAPRLFAPIMASPLDKKGSGGSQASTSAPVGGARGGGGHGKEPRLHLHHSSSHGHHTQSSDAAGSPSSTPTSAAVTGAAPAAYSSGAAGTTARISMAHTAAAHQYDEVFAWDRCVSRLIEMGSEEYLQQPWKPGMG